MPCFGGASQGADLMVDVGRKKALPIYANLEDIPPAH